MVKGEEWAEPRGQSQSYWKERDAASLGFTHHIEGEGGGVVNEGGPMAVEAALEGPAGEQIDEEGNREFYDAE